MRFPLLLAAATLAGCTSIVATTVAQLDQISPLSADPANFAVQISLPDGVGVAPGTAEVIFSGRETRSSDPLSGTFVLAQQGEVFRFDDDDLDAIRALQAQFAAWEDADPAAASGSIGVNMVPCTRGPGPQLGDRVSISVQIAEGGVFLPLVRNAPLRSFVEQPDLDALPPCA